MYIENNKFEIKKTESPSSHQNIKEIQCIKARFKGYYKFVFLHVTDEKNSTENQDYFEVKPTIHFYVPPKSKDLKIQIQ